MRNMTIAEAACKCLTSKYRAGSFRPNYRYRFSYANELFDVKAAWGTMEIYTTNNELDSVHLIVTDGHSVKLRQENASLINKRSYQTALVIFIIVAMILAMFAGCKPAGGSGHRKPDTTDSVVVVASDSGVYDLDVEKLRFDTCVRIMQLYPDYKADMIEGVTGNGDSAAIESHTIWLSNVSIEINETYYPKTGMVSYHTFIRGELNDLLPYIKEIHALGVTGWREEDTYSFVGTFPIIIKR